MNAVGIDFGVKKISQSKWIEDPYKLTADGIPFCITYDNGKNSAETCIVFGKEVQINDVAANRIASYPKNSISGCFQFFPVLKEDSLAFENEFNPCKVINKEGISYFEIEIANGKKRQVSVFVPTIFYFEYQFFRTLRNQNDMYYMRNEVANRQSSEKLDWFITIPDYFGNREVDMLKSVISWQNYSHITFVKSCIPPVLEYGYYNPISTNTSRVCLFVDSGHSHTTFTVAEYTQSTMTILYSRVNTKINGRAFTKILLDLACGDALEDLKDSRKNYMRCLNKIEKAKIELNCEGIDEVYIDLSDYLDDEQFEEEVCILKDDYYTAIQEIITLFSTEVQTVLDAIASIYHKKIDLVFPLGGNMCMDILQQELKTIAHQHNPAITKLQYTMNSMDCFMMGSTLMGHLLEKNELIIDPALINTLIYPTASSIPLPSSSSSSTAVHLQLHPQAILQFPQTQHQSFETYKEEVLQQYHEILEAEADIQRVNTCCLELEKLLQETDTVLTSYASLQEKSSEQLIEELKQTVVTRFGLSSFPQCFTCEAETKKSKWWKNKELVLKKYGMKVTDYCKELLILKQKVYQDVYTSSHAKLNYNDILNEYKEFSSLLKQFKDSCQSIENTCSLVLYEIVNRLYSKKYHKRF